MTKSLANYIAELNGGEPLMIDREKIYDEFNKEYEKGGYAHPMKIDTVNHPPHYTAHPSGVECIQITEHMNFCLGNAVKYIWRADLKHDAIEDLKKAVWYVNREIERRQKNKAV